MMTPTKNDKTNDDTITMWKGDISKRIRRMEVFFLTVTVSFITFLSYKVILDLSSQYELQQTISLISDTQGTVLNQIEMMNSRIHKIEQDKLLNKDFIQPPSSSSSIHRKVLAAPKDDSDSVTWFKKPINKIEQNEVTIETIQPSQSIHRKYLAAPEGFLRETTVKNVKAVSMHHPNTTSRRIQSLINPIESGASCNGTLFRLEIQLDGRAQETSFILIEIDTGNTIQHTTFSKNHSHTEKTFEICLDNWHYQFLLQDSFGDGIQCENSFNGLPCYNIYFNNELTIPGQAFQNSLLSHEFDLNSQCFIGNVVVYEFNFDVGSAPAEGISSICKITNIQTKEEVEMLLIPDQKQNGTKTSFFQCLDSSIYNVEFFPAPQSITSCNGPCYSISMNNKTIIEGKGFISQANHQFFITTDGVASEKTCRINPPLSPIHNSHNLFDERVSKLMDVIQALSKVKDIFAEGSSQYQATCYILNDDPLQIQVEDTKLVQRYAIAVFLYSTNEMAEVHLGLDLCLDDKFQCNEQGDIIAVGTSKYIKQK